METHLVEYKQNWSDELLEWICGYANALGGTLYIGKDDHGDVIGLDKPKKLSEDIPNKIKSTLGIVVDVLLLQECGKWYIQIETPPVNQIISYRGKIFYRSGASKQILEGPSLTTFVMDKFNMSFDSITIDDLSIDDFDNDAFRIYKEEAIRNNRLSSKEHNLSKTELMEKLHLIKKGKITYAGMLMFYQDPEKYIPACYTKVGYFNDGSDLKYMDDIHGPLVKQVIQTIEILYAKYFRSYEEFKGVRRITHYQYPEEVIREAVCNAIIHRNYSQCNTVQIKVFPDKLMIFNNCIFPNGWTIDNLLKPHESKALNPLIAYAFYVMGYIDTWGRGIDKIVNGLMESGQGMPEFEETKYSFCVTLKPKFINHTSISEIKESQKDHSKVTVKSQKSHSNITKNMNYILEIIKDDPYITTIEIAKKLNLKRETISRNISKMKVLGLIKRIGDDKGGYWSVNKKI